MRLAPPESLEARPGFSRADSDIVVALIRTAFIIAYFILRAHGQPRLFDETPDLLWRRALWLLDSIALTAALFNLILLLLYLSGRSLRLMRPGALLMDLLLLGTAVAVFRRVGYDAFDLYYLILIPAAIWYRRTGAVLVALAAALLAVFLPQWLFGKPFFLGGAWRMALEQGVPLLLIGLITGYLVRARDVEHQEAIALRQEMRLAHFLQRQMLPATLPSSPFCDLGVVFAPARIVGGDFYDVRLLDDNHLLIVLADMSGKSVYGLFHLSLVQSHLQAALREGLTLAAAAQRVNRSTYAALQPENFAALFLGVLRLSDGYFRFVNCGHVPPLHFSASPSHSISSLAGGGPVIGAFADPSYQEQSLWLAEGEILVCFSDGLSEARNRHKEFFGQERIAAIINENKEASAQAMAECLHEALKKFAIPAGQDDITIIVLRRRLSAS